MNFIPMPNEQAQAIVQQLQNSRFTGTGGGGLVMVKMTHDFCVENVEIAP
jgi:DNA-binding protein YbaB